MEISYGIGALGTYVKVRDGIAMHSGLLTEINVIVYATANTSSAPYVAFELKLGMEPDLTGICNIFEMNQPERDELERMWPLVMEGHLWK
jgi:hypothetical protein